MKNMTLALEMLKLTRSTFSGKRSVTNLQKCNGMKSVKTAIWRISISSEVYKIVQCRVWPHMLCKSTA